VSGPTWTTSNPPAFAKRTSAGFEMTQRDATLTNPELDALPSAARCPPSLVAFEPKKIKFGRPVLTTRRSHIMYQRVAVSEPAKPRPDARAG